KQTCDSRHSLPPMMLPRTIGVFLEGCGTGVVDAMLMATRSGKGLVVLRAGSSAVAATRSRTGALGPAPQRSIVRSLIRREPQRPAIGPRLAASAASQLATSATLRPA